MNELMEDALTNPAPVRNRADGQVTGLAGELFVAAELLKRGLQTSITFGNAKAVDLLAFNPATGQTFTVQVKSLRKKNIFPITHARVEARHTYVFTVLNGPGQPVQYYVVPGHVLVNDPARFSKWFLDPKFPGIPANQLADFTDGWHVFDELPMPTLSPPCSAVTST